MKDPALRGLRWFVAASLLAGGVLLLVEARLVRESAPGREVLAATVAAWSALLAVVAILGIRRRLPWASVSAALLASLMAAVAWAHFDPAGHLVLGGLAPAVAVLAGVGIARSERWAWPVALAIAAGIGPLFLTFAPLPDAAYAGAIVIFLADALALLALGDTFFKKGA